MARRSATPRRPLPAHPLTVGKLELPSLAHVHSRGPAEWYQPPDAAAPRSSLLSGDRLPDLQLPASAPSRVCSFDSTAGAYPPSLTSNASSYAGFDPKTPSPSEGSSPHHSLPLTYGAGTASYGIPQFKKEGEGPSYHQGSCPARGAQAVHGSYGASGSDSSSNVMNQQPPYLDSHSHMTTGSSYAALSQTSGAGAMSHYQHYPSQSSMSQGGGAYAPTGSSYGNYYGANVTSPQSAGGSTAAPMSMQQLPSLAMPPSAHPQHQYGSQGSQGGGGGGGSYPHPYDQTGQTAPPGMVPRVTATLWEDEGSLCFQVEARGVCVARREDNHFINGTKLLNVAGMTRGRRDGILKSEKAKHVVKIGPMHLKGVWYAQSPWRGKCIG